jgi:hypothetical protein
MLQTLPGMESLQSRMKVASSLKATYRRLYVNISSVKVIRGHVIVDAMKRMWSFLNLILDRHSAGEIGEG